MRGRALSAALLVAAGGLGPAVAAKPAQRDALARARLLYNQEQFDAAIAEAVEARAVGPAFDAAALVLARAHLERFRRTADPADLTSAREALREIRPEALSGRDRGELVIGLGQSLYFEEAYGAAAELFESALARAADVTPTAYERVLDWWASALDRQAQPRPSAARAPIYGRIVARMEEELRRDPGSTPAAYWLAAAARGRGELDRAWEAAIAGWVRAPLARDRGAALRADLDRLIQQAIIPERARQHAVAPRDPLDVAEEMRAEWELVKEKWTGR